MTRPSRPLNLQNSPASNKAIAATNATNSPLLKLPAELRQKIYDYVLGGNVLHVASGSVDGPHRVVICANNGDYMDDAACRAVKQEPPGLKELHFDDVEYYYCFASHEQCYRASPVRTRFSLQLLGTCRQIYHEAVLVPFKKNIFVATPYHIRWSVNRLRYFNQCLVPAQIQAIRHLIVQTDRLDWTHPQACTAKHIKAYKGLIILQHILVVESTSFSHLDAWVERQESFFTSAKLAELQLSQLHSVRIEVRRSYDRWHYAQHDGRGAEPLPTAMQEWVESAERTMLGDS